ncbi:MAG: DUF2291 domain-containing protein [Azospirillaceae bacterium]|nr:DUF2291 domain-containing protein [Azospirillaceae bacterium]
MSLSLRLPPNLPHPALTTPGARGSPAIRLLRRRLFPGLLVLALISLPACKLVRNAPASSADNHGASSEAVNQGFNAAGYVAGIWDQQLLPYVAAQAVPATTVLAALRDNADAAGKAYGHRANDSTPWNFVVRGDGVITAANTASRAATIDVALLPSTSPPAALPAADLRIQIGPVIAGTAVRDAADFIKFGSVTNQLEFAQVSRAINDRIRDQTLKDFPRDNLVGRKVSFRGMFTAPASGTLPVIAPLSLGIMEATP